jgi:hypothetical protein
VIREVLPVITLIMLVKIMLVKKKAAMRVSNWIEGKIGL